MVLGRNRRAGFDLLDCCHAGSQQEDLRGNGRKDRRNDYASLQSRFLVLRPQIGHYARARENQTIRITESTSVNRLPASPDRIKA
jgi:hypothetical protein